MPHTLRAVHRDDETLAALKMLAGFHDGIAKDATRTKNRLRSVLTQEDGDADEILEDFPEPG